MGVYLKGQLSKFKNSGTLNVLLDRISITIQYVNKEQVQCIWRKQEVGTAKLNPDSSMSENGSGIGGIIRDSDGRTMLAYIGARGPRSVLYQELRAILVGLKGCQKLKLLNGY
ncbi:hypothetical protein IFM89_017919 [Coptis chinensis]|uniref:RNase H type-1 domain-containing protein n=1 Tax=Coptis chinensis TaxID=261450 RepID=A0A835LZW0_9MAGN|nr:hypothetical protein IFM89_017919 [Coptis chinensis]